MGIYQEHNFLVFHDFIINCFKRNTLITFVKESFKKKLLINI